MNTSSNPNSFQQILKAAVAVSRGSIHNGGTICSDKLKQIKYKDNVWVKATVGASSTTDTKLQSLSKIMVFSHAYSIRSVGKAAVFAVSCHQY